MKAFKYHLPGINPINRDLAIIFIIGFITSLIIVAVGYMVFVQV